MLEPVPELSSDLEWMLQSGQATAEMLVQALVEDYYQPVFRLGYAVLGDEDVARQAARDTFCQALLNVFRYRSATGIDVWLYRQAAEAIRRRQAARLKPAGDLPSLGSPLPGEGSTLVAGYSTVWQAIDRLPDEVRLMLAMHALQRWDPGMIAQVLRARERVVLQRLEAGYQVIQTVMNQDTSARTPADLNGDLPERLAGILRERQTDVKTTRVDIYQDEAGATVAYVLSQTHQTGNLIRRFASVKEVLLVIVAAFVIGAFIWGANIVAPEPETTPVPTRRVNPAGVDLPKDTPLRRNRRTPPAKPTLTPTSRNAFYTVEEGDTPESISAHFCFPVQELLDFNRLPYGEQPVEGQVLVIPYITPAPGETMTRGPCG